MDSRIQKEDLLFPCYSFVSFSSLYLILSNLENMKIMNYILSNRTIGNSCLSILWITLWFGFVYCIKSQVQIWNKWYKGMI